MTVLSRSLPFHWHIITAVSTKREYTLESKASTQKPDGLEEKQGLWSTTYFPFGPPKFLVFSSTKVYTFFWRRLQMTYNTIQVLYGIYGRQVYCMMNLILRCHDRLIHHKIHTPQKPPSGSEVLCNYYLFSLKQFMFCMASL